MTALAGSVLVLCLFVANSRAFLAAPVPVHGMPSYDIVGAERHLKENEVIHKINENHDHSDNSSANHHGGGKHGIYLFEFESESSEKEETGNGDGDDSIQDGQMQSPLDPWSIVWYIGSFGGLVAFFLIVSCSEWCCRRGGRPLAVPYAQRGEPATATTTIADTPPPPYHLFAPPPYDSVNYGDVVHKSAEEKLDIYVIPVPIHRPVVEPPP